MSLNPSSIGMLLLVLKEEGRDKSYQIVSDMNAELTRLAPYAKMVEQITILAQLNIQVSFSQRFLCYIQSVEHGCKSSWDGDNVVNAFDLALSAYLSSLPDSQRTELAQKLGVE